jgi:hypothetical protein
MSKLAWSLAAAMLTAVFAASAAPGPSGIDAVSPAGTIYEWVDDNGLKHASDSVPEKYKGVARRVDPSRFQLPAGEQEEAEREAMALKAKAASAVPLSKPAGATARPGLVRAASLSGNPPVADTPECAAWRRQLAASRECFFSFSNPDGSGGGLHSCSNEPDPEPPDAACRPEGSR